MAEAVNCDAGDLQDEVLGAAQTAIAYTEHTCLSQFRTRIAVLWRGAPDTVDMLADPHSLMKPIAQNGKDQRHNLLVRNWRSHPDAGGIGQLYVGV